MYAYFSDIGCDPLAEGVVTNGNQVNISEISRGDCCSDLAHTHINPHKPGVLILVIKALGKQYSPGALLFAYMNFIEKWNKNEKLLLMPPKN